jgi:hypothetical protein
VKDRECSSIRVISEISCRCGGGGVRGGGGGVRGGGGGDVDYRG